MINIGIIGLRGMGTDRIRTLGSAGNAQLASICTRNTELLESVSLEFGISKTSTKWEDVVTDPTIDAVCVCTPNNLHFEIARSAISNGKHVLIEYPLAVTLEQVAELIAAARDAGVILHEGLTTRYEPRHLKVKELVPTLGEPLEVHGFMRWPTMWKWARDENIMGSYFGLANFHLVDQLVDIYGQPKWVTASLWKRRQEGALSKISGSMFFGYESGLSAYVSYSMGVPNQDTFMQFRLVHAEGMVELRDDNLYVTRDDGSVEMIAVQEIHDDSILRDTMQFIQEIESGHSDMQQEQTALATRVCLYAQLSCANDNAKIEIAPGTD